MPSLSFMYFAVYFHVNLCILLHTVSFSVTLTWAKVSLSGLEHVWRVCAQVILDPRVAAGKKYVAASWYIVVFLKLAVSTLPSAC